MLFVEFKFIFIFLPAVLFFHFLSKNVQYRISVLLFFSLLFYSAWDINFLPILLASILGSFYFGRLLARESAYKFWFFLMAISSALLPLAYFKYAGFFHGALGLTRGAGLIYQGLLPLGISFFTFQQITYLVDIYKGLISPSKSIVRYGFFVSFFPQLIAGPIVHYTEITSQIGRSYDENKYYIRGFWYFLIGFAKKTLIADQMAVFANRVFENTADLTFFESLTGTLGYTFQIYFDFSGYSDMAIGLALLFGFQLPINFNSPYKAISIIDFWRRWHITLSGFLRDYVYIPLGGNRKGAFNRHRNMLLTMLIGGLWHGASWTFVVWGGLHGLALGVNHFLLNKFDFKKFRWMGYPTTFTFVALTWVLFRAETFKGAQEVYKGFLKFAPYQFNSSHLIFVLGFILIFFPHSHALVEKLSVFRFPNPTYLIGLLQKRWFLYSTAGGIIFSLFGTVFYQGVVDKKIYASLPTYSKSDFIEIKKGDFRSNLYVNKIFKGNEKKVMIVGSSFIKNSGLFYFEKNGEKYKSGSLGIGGNLINNGYRTLLSILDTPGLDTIILGVHALNFGPPSYSSVFSKECYGELKKTGMKAQIKEKRLSNCFPVKLNVFEKILLIIAPESPMFFQIQGFIYKFFHRNPPSFTPSTLSLGKTEQKVFYKKLDQKRNSAVKNGIPPKGKNGYDKTFKWEARGILKSLAPGEMHDQIFQYIKQKANEKGIKLVVFNSPTPTYEAHKKFYPLEADRIYPKGWYEKYLKKFKKLMEKNQITYLDLSEFFPWRNEFMFDFIHPHVNSNPEINPRAFTHKHLIYQVYGEK